MSIPKDPRQLMINLMYIVLTALLALNVSAEILHAFFTIDESLQESSKLVESSNQKLAKAINDQIDAYPEFETYKEKVSQAQTIAQTFFNEVGVMKSELIELAGGLDENDLPVRLSDKDITTKFLVKEGRGAELEKRILEIRTQLLNLIEQEEERNILAKNLPLKVHEIPTNSEKKTWAQFAFQQMPVAAVIPVLTKFQNDVKVAETAILNHFFNEMNLEIIKPNEFIPVVSADKSYIVRGESYKSEIFLGAYNSTADNISVSIDGRAVPVVDGKAIFETRPNSIGNKSHKLHISVTNPQTGTVNEYTKVFGYEVGERSVTVSADKMNVLYIGVENPLSISAAGVPSGTIKVKAEGFDVSRVSGGKYVTIPKKPGIGKITVSGENLKPTSFEYRIKRIPNPVAMLGSKKGGLISASEIKVYEGIFPMLENFDFETQCNVVGFELVRQPDKDDVQIANNKGRKFQPEAKRIINKAKRGDTFYFDKIKVKCPGDISSRLINGMVFRIR